MPLLSKSLKFIILILFLSLHAGNIESQVLQDTAALNLVKATVDQIYNMQFSDAAETTRQIGKKYPEHPVVYLLKGMILYWEGYPLISGSEESREFENQMKLCISSSEDPGPDNEAEYLLANLCARGSLLGFYTGNDLQSKVISIGRSTYRKLRRAFDFTGTYPDFLFFTGLYNYYREAYADAHPVYRPILALFPRGDKERGMYELRRAFRLSIFLKAEASTFLSSNYKYFENDFANASYFSRLIFRNYPENIIYRINCIEDLILVKKYDEAGKLISAASPGPAGRYYQAQIIILHAILSEKNKDLDKAEQDYRRGIEMISEFSNYGNQYTAYAYFGLSRISAARNDNNSQRIFHRRALDLTDFDNVTFN